MIDCRIAFIIGVVTFSSFSSEAKRPLKKVLHAMNNSKQKAVSKPKDVALNKIPQIEKCDAVSKKARRLEHSWKQSFEKLTQMNKRIEEITGNMKKHNDAFSKNVDYIMNNKTSSSTDGVIVSHYSEVANRKYREMAFNNTELTKLKNDARKQSQEQDKIRMEINALKEKISACCGEKAISKLIADNITCIAQETDNVVDLVRRLSSELSSGALRGLPKCKSTVPHSYPVEALSINRTVTSPFDFGYQLVNIDVTARSGALVFAPCSGTIVFSKPLKKLGHTIAMHNSDCLVVMCGLGQEFFSVGQVIAQGQIIGTLDNTQGDNSPAAMKYIIRTRLNKHGQKTN